MKQRQRDNEMTYYLVNGTYSFTHYGKAKAFARRINGRVEVKKTYNIFSWLYSAI